jgi:hypothetical protein
MISGMLSSMLMLLTPEILQELMARRGIGYQVACGLLYKSMVYKMLEDEKTGLWRSSYILLADMLEEEIATGGITLPAEQI